MKKKLVQMLLAAGLAFGALGGTPAQAWWGPWDWGPWGGGPWGDPWIGGPWGGYPYYPYYGGYPYWGGYPYAYPYGGLYYPYYGYSPYAAPSNQTEKKADKK